VAITHDPHEVMDYSMKTIKQGRVAFDDEIVLPRSWSERQRTALELSAKDRAIKHIASSTNVSETVATQYMRQNHPNIRPSAHGINSRRDPAKVTI